jgi:hypothetical protein
VPLVLEVREEEVVERLAWAATEVLIHLVGLVVTPQFKVQAKVNGWLEQGLLGARMMVVQTLIGVSRLNMVAGAVLRLMAILVAVLFSVLVVVVVDTIQIMLVGLAVLGHHMSVAGAVVLVVAAVGMEVMETPEATVVAMEEAVVQPIPLAMVGLEVLEEHQEEGQAVVVVPLQTLVAPEGLEPEAK